LSDSLPSPALKKVGSRFGSSGVFCLALGSLTPWIPRSLWGTMDGRCISPSYPGPGVRLFWVPSTAPTLRRASVDRPRSGEFLRIRHAWVFLSCLLGALWAFCSCGSCAGVPRAAAVFPWPVPDPGICFAVGLGHRPCSLRLRLEGLAGGSCLSSPWWSADSFRIQLFCPYSRLLRIRDLSCQTSGWVNN
jgi:hypothetical protein